MSSLSLALIITAIVAPTALRSSRRMIQDVRDQAYLSVHAFAQSANVWLERGDRETLSRVSNLMLSTGSVYVLIVEEGETILAEARQATPEFEARLIETPQESRTIYRQAGDLSYVDTLIPLRTSPSGAPAEYVRVGIEVSFLSSQLAAARLRATLVAAGVWGLLSGSMIAAALWGRRRGASTAYGLPDVPPTSQTGMRALGGLMLDIARREVTVFDAPIRLTPKQFDLLVVLTSEDRRVFSEDEILSRVWPDSAYADSNDIRQCIYRLRQRFKKAHHGSDAAIVNVKGFGYQFDPGKLALCSDMSSYEEGEENA